MLWMISDSRSMTPSLSGDKPPSSLDTFIIPHRLICTYYPELNRHACPAPPRHSPYWCDRNRGWENVPFAAGRPIRSAGIIGWHQKVVSRQPLSLDIRRWKKQKNELMLMLSLLLLGTVQSIIMPLSTQSIRIDPFVHGFDSWGLFNCPAHWSPARWWFPGPSLAGCHSHLIVPHGV
jgi:hypothetical protein